MNVENKDSVVHYFTPTFSRQSLIPRSALIFLANVHLGLRAALADHALAYVHIA